MGGNCSPGSPEWERAVDLVLLELGSTQRRLRAAVDGAMLAERRRQRALGKDAFPAHLAQSMIAAWCEFLQHRELMRYPIEGKRFLAEGIWRDQRRWPWDQAKLAQFSRARVGT